MAPTPSEPTHHPPFSHSDCLRIHTRRCVTSPSSDQAVSFPIYEASTHKRNSQRRAPISPVEIPKRRTGRLDALPDWGLLRPVTLDGSSNTGGRPKILKSDANPAVRSQHSLVNSSQGVDHSLSIPSVPPDRLNQLPRPPAAGPRESSIWPTNTAVVQTQGNPEVLNHNKMHQLVHRDDYLPARGANPRTGVVTPGEHSANGSMSSPQAKDLQIQDFPSRWRQRGDQEISLDHGEPSPSASTSLLEEMPQILSQHLSQNPRLSQRLAQANANMRVTDGQSPFLSGARFPRSAGQSSFDDISTSFHMRQLPDGIGIYQDGKTDVPARRKFSYEYNADPELKRKPVPSPLGQAQSQDRGSGDLDNDGSGETVVRRLRFPADIRASSAPDPPKWRYFTPADIGKDLPSLPPEARESELVTQPVQSHADVSLDQSRPKKGPSDPGSKTSGTSGRPSIDKELPCLPTNNGQSRSTLEVTNLSTNKGDRLQPSVTMPLNSQPRTPAGPRGGNPAYPYTRPAYHSDPRPITSNVRHLYVDKAMPVPTYDNPPRGTSPLVRNSAPLVEGPRPMPLHKPRMPQYPRDAFPQEVNSTFTSTNMSTFAQPMQAGPRQAPPFPGHRMMNQNQKGYPARTNFLGLSDTSMNISMNMGSDHVMASMPMPRIRPRGTRPPMPKRPEGSFGVPSTHVRPVVSETGYYVPWSAPPLYGQGLAERHGHDADLIPSPLKPRFPTNPDQLLMSSISNLPESTKATTTGLGLMRKCSRCNHGFVEDKILTTDGVIPTSGHASQNEVTGGGHKGARPTKTIGLDSVREDNSEIEGDAFARTGLHSPKHETQERHLNHDKCCPDCCKKEDCHGGCVGHASPNSTPSPTKSIWSEMDCVSSASELEDWEMDSVKSEKYRRNRFAFVRSAFKRSTKHDRPSSNSSSASTSPGLDKSSSGSPTLDCVGLASPAASTLSGESGGHTEGLNAAMKAAGSRTRTARDGGTCRRQLRSSSSPNIGIGAFFGTGGGAPGQPSAGSSISVPRSKMGTPRGLAIDCTGSGKGRSISGNSVSTIEVQMPGLGSFGFGAIGEMAIVPFDATRMWIRNHPQVMQMGWAIIERAWQMGQVMMLTGWRLWTLVFVYSKTGRFKLSVKKGDSAGGFLVDCARSALYLMIFAAVGAFLMRVLSVLMGALGAIGWVLTGACWIVKKVLGVGLVK
ncbi:hypothetical protein PV10_06845 [Exophiala mesophila]|uniref:Uncharacterized protein n=1 Tax=Exophiala mesophila TaxID=212818 RepID=A0A0D1WKH2_EXOME|nr:uncharacterized protein PV10_06845 [Exophiala mesophila]KIV89445.1 hypothetical protein PV10_06845 [Exophiala mesophila]